MVHNNLNIVCKGDKTFPVNLKIKRILIHQELIKNFGFEGITLTHTEEVNTRNMLQTKTAVFDQMHDTDN